MFGDRSRGTIPVRGTVFIAALACCLAPALRSQADTSRTASAGARAVDPLILPGDDFFAYANGGWMKATEIPPGKERWSARDEINALTRIQIATVLDDARHAPKGSTARKVADFRAAWMNEAAIEAKGIAPLKPPLDRIDAVADKLALTRLLARSMGADVDPMNWGVYESATLLGLSVEPSIHGERTYVAFLLQGGLGLPDREDYLDAEPRRQALRATYREYIGALLAFAGLDRAEQRSDGVLALETAIARSHSTAEQSANDHNADSVWTRADFARRAPGIEWTAFFAAAGLGAESSFVAWQPSAITGAAALIASQPLETWKDYLRFHLLAAYADVLPKAVAERAMDLNAAAMPGQPPAGSRDQRALDATQAMLGDAVGRVYVERYFPAAQKARVRHIVDEVTAAFIARVDAATWMSPAWKEIAIAKLRALYVGVGYPDRWPDYSDLTIDPADAVGNVRRVAERERRRAIARLGRPVDQKDWVMEPQRVGAVLVFQQNLYDFSAALLQAPKYDASASEAASYGAIGAIIAHDVTHFVDVLGAEYAVDGATHRWWTPEDSVRYAARTAPLAAQFSTYHPFPDATIDGTLTERENVADLTGLVAAFDAYRKALGKRTADTGVVRRLDREFFIAFAQAWRTKMSEAAMRAQLANDHAPDMYRVFTVRNIDAWYEAFDVRPGQRLYLAPDARVRIW